MSIDTLFLVERASDGIVPSRQNVLIGLQIFLICFSFTSFALRIYARTCISSSYGVDDVLMGVAMIFNIGLTVNSCIAGKLGWGRHKVDVSPQNADTMLLVIWIAELLFSLTSSFIKISILYFYLRIAVTKLYRCLIHGSIVFIILWTVAFISIIIFQCHPISSFWNYGDTQCFGLVTPLIIHGILNILSDFFIFVLPQPMLWKLQVPKAQKIGMFLLFGVGFLDCVAGTLRLYFTVMAHKSDDEPWLGVYFWTFQAVEVNIAIFLASVPSFKVIFTRLYPSLNSTTRRGQGTYASNNYNISRSGTMKSSRNQATSKNIPGSTLRQQKIHDDRIYSLKSFTSIGGSRIKTASGPESQENLTDGEIFVVKSYQVRNTVEHV